MKKLSIFLAIILSTLFVFFSGCVIDLGELGTTNIGGRDGRDGRDGKDVTITEVYDEYKKTHPDTTFEQFLKEYLSYTDEQFDLQSTINKSLMSSVSILTRFAYPATTSYLTTYTYKVYTGSGVILNIDKARGDAYIATNCHVVYDDTSTKKFCEDIRLYLYGQDINGVNYKIDADSNITDDNLYRMQAKLLGASVTYDVALLKVEGSEVLKRSDAMSAQFSKATDVYVGENVYAVGNASGEGLAASNGIISKDSEHIELSLSEKNKEDLGSYRVIRTTAAINHGNSGGALFNVKGEIVGLVNSKDDSADIDNMGYVLPANNVRRILKSFYDDYVANGNRMLDGGGLKKAIINVTTQAGDSYSVYNKTIGRAEIHELIKIVNVNGLPARGLLQVGDIIKHAKLSDSSGKVYDEVVVTRNHHVTELMFSARAGDTVTLTVERGGIDKQVSIKLEAGNFTSID